MNLSQNGDSSSFLNADEASAIETAVRTAVMSILKVFYAVNEKRAHCYEVKLAETDKENAELKFQLREAEQELQALRQIASNYRISAEVTLSHDTSTDPTEERGEETAASSQSDGRPVIKEEPSSETTLCLKRETLDETFAAECDYPVMDSIQVCQQTEAAEIWNMEYLQTFGSGRSSCNPTTEKRISGNVLKKRVRSRERMRRYRERIRADPEKHLAWKEKERLRSQLRRKTINELSEPMKKMKRKAWREAKKKQFDKMKAQSTAMQTIQMTTW